jgi:hypothetical protein
MLEITLIKIGLGVGLVAPPSTSCKCKQSKAMRHNIASFDEKMLRCVWDELEYHIICRVTKGSHVEYL